MDKTYIAIDLKSFYASVECLDRGLDPLQALLVVADISRTSKTICLAVTPGLKELGLCSRPRLFEVEQFASSYYKQHHKKLDYIVACPRMARYIEYSSKVYRTYLKYFDSSDIHVYSIDEVFIDVTSYLKLYKKSPEALTREVISEINRETGLTATGGIGTNLYLAKVSMDIVAKHKKADRFGVRIASLDETSYRFLLWNHKPITDFWRIGPGIALHLRRMGLNTMGDIARFSLTPRGENLLYEEFGVDGEILIDHAWGYENVGLEDIKSYRSRERSLSQGQVLHGPVSKEQGSLILKEMIELLALDMESEGLSSSRYTIHIVYDQLKDSYSGPCGLDRYGRVVPLPSHGTCNLSFKTRQATCIRKEVLTLYDRIVDESLYVHALYIIACNVVYMESEEGDLFTDRDTLNKSSKVNQTVLELQKKYGKNLLLKGFNLEEGGTTIERNLQIGGHKA